MRTEEEQFSNEVEVKKQTNCIVLNQVC